MRWLSYGLAHFRGQYWNAEKPRLLISHLFKMKDDPGSSIGDGPRFVIVRPQSLADAAVTAVVQYVSDNNALGLPEEDCRAWTRKTIETQVTQKTLDTEWRSHQMVLDDAAVPARMRQMPNGFCIVAETNESYLAVSARHMPTSLRLIRQDPELRRYRTR